MKSSTYSSLVTIVFLKHKKQISRSIESVIRTTDQLGIKLGLKIDLSHMTKYRIIHELMRSGILANRRTNRNIKIKFSKNILQYFITNMI